MATNRRRDVVLGMGTLGVGTLAALIAVACASIAEEPAGSKGQAATINPTITVPPKPTYTVTINPCILAQCPDDGNPCTRDCTVVGGSAQCGHVEITCDDGNPCTTDSCDSKTGECVNEDNTNDCSDGDPCTTNDKCGKGTCKGTPIGCDDNNPCTTDSCKEGNCVFDPVDDGAECDDQNGCTSGDECNSGVCVGTGGPDCDDGNPCTKNSCSASECSWDDLEPEGTPCLHENKCLVNTACNADGECTSDEEKNCDDNNPCTVDSCDPEVGCVHEPDDDLECSDGDACTLEDRCVDGECVGDVPVECAPLDECHVAGTCDPLTGACSDPRKPDGETCENTGTCEAGKCVGGTPTPIGEGGAGGADAGGAAGDASSSGGTAGAGEEEPSAAGADGEPEPGEGGAPGEPSGGGEGGDPTEETPPAGEAFKRDSGGCTVASGTASGSATWPALLLGALGLGVLRRRRSAGRAERSA